MSDKPKNLLKTYAKDPVLWLFILSLLLAYWTSVALEVGIKYNLVPFAETVKQLNHYNSMFFRDRMDLMTLLGHHWDLSLKYLLSYLFLGVLGLVGLIKFLQKFVGVRKFIYKQLISLKVAVIVMIIVAILSAIGTVVESSRNDPTAAQILVFHSWWMYGTLAFMSAQLIAVMVDRWPWKIRHASFVLAHIGILVTFYGSLLTRYFGVDGSMIFQIGQDSKFVMLTSTDIKVLSTFDGERFSQLYYDKVNFMKNPPTRENPYVIQFGKKTIKIIDYLPYAFREAKTQESNDPRDRAALRYQIEGSRANISNWMRLDRRRMSESTSVGPLTITLTEFPHREFKNRNELIFYPVSKDEIGFKVYSQKKKGLLKQGKVKVGDVFPLGFMDFNVRIINYFQDSSEKVTYKEMPNKSEFTVSAVLAEFNGREQWSGGNANLRFFEDDRMYILSYGNEYIQLDFKMKLEEFKVGRYQGTNRAATYESDVTVPDIKGKINISMNEPLDYKDFRFFQASFQEDERGNPTASVLSVNNDPGRFLKYLGSLLITLGTIFLFYFRRWGHQLEKWFEN